MSSKIFPKLCAIVVLFNLFWFSDSLDTLDETRNLTNGETLVSSGGIFEFGFFRPGRSTNWYVGIWYVVSPEVVVWVANRDQPMNQSSSTITISKGEIVLVDPSQRILWSSGVDSSTITMSNLVMRLLDSGNLVLKQQNRVDPTWQSFDHPSNTLLPGMKLGKNLVTRSEWFLTSWSSAEDPSRGMYQYKMDAVGALENVLWKNNTEIIYRTGPWDGSKFSGVLAMDNYSSMFNFKIVSDANETYYSFEAIQGNLSRLVLNETNDGLIQRWMWHETRHIWLPFWSLPADECDNYMHCGPFGICNKNDATTCGCIQGFDPKSPGDWSARIFSGGCKRKTNISRDDEENDFTTVKGVKLPDTHNATVHANISDEECRSRCLMNDTCLAYSISDIIHGTGCITWSSDLLDIRYINGAQDLYVKVAKSDLAETGSKKRRRAARVGIILASTIVFLLVTLLSGIIVWKKIFKRDHLDQSSSLKDTELPIFDVATVAASTSNFSAANKLGQGGFGAVYKGQLPTGEDIAVKRLSKDSSQGLSEFINEVMLIAKLQHRNLVRLLGCCIQGSERMLIYEYMTNKSLDFFIFDKERRTLLNWRSRLEIIIGIARGLLYLHEDSRFNIIHRDLKAANILLDGEMTPKISDFGIARMFKREQIEIATETVVGTRGYMAPEYAMEGKISVKSDVYSFGVLVLEIISGTRNSGNQNLPVHAWKLWEENMAIHLADEAILDSLTVASEIVRSVHVGLLCVQECADDRPTMSEVALMLSSDSTNLPEPKKPVISRKIMNSEFRITDELSLYSNELTVTIIEGR